MLGWDDRFLSLLIYTPTRWCTESLSCEKDFISSNDPVLPSSHSVIVQVAENEQFDDSLCCFMLLNQYFTEVALLTRDTFNHSAESRKVHFTFHLKSWTRLYRRHIQLGEANGYWRMRNSCVLEVRSNHIFDLLPKRPFKTFQNTTQLVSLINFLKEEQPACENKKKKYSFKQLWEISFRDSMSEHTDVSL